MKKTKEERAREFLSNSRNKFGDRYEYDISNYERTTSIIKIKCPIHGWIETRPFDHLQSQFGCKECSYEYRGQKHRMTNEEFIEKAHKIHNDYYDYSITNYTKINQNINIICPKHGKFSINPHNHLCGEGCRLCGYEKRAKSKTKTFENFIEKANKVHNGFYTYNNAKYINRQIPILITCPEHGDFLQVPYDHLSGCGCSQCKSSFLEKEIRMLLQNNNITFIEQAGRKQFQWLGLQTLDFYLPDYQIAIECQGNQHFQPIEFFGGEAGFQNAIERDNRKHKKCEENGVKILYYTNTNLTEYPYEVFTNKELLLNEIKKHNKHYL